MLYCVICFESLFHVLACLFMPIDVKPETNCNQRNHFFTGGRRPCESSQSILCDFLQKVFLTAKNIIFGNIFLFWFDRKNRRAINNGKVV